MLATLVSHRIVELIAIALALKTFIRHWVFCRSKPMSFLLDALADKFRDQEDNQARELAIDYFRQSTQPWHDLLDYLLTLSSSSQKPFQLIQCLVQAFLQCQVHLGPLPSANSFDGDAIEALFLHDLPSDVLPDFCTIFQLNKNYRLSHLRNALAYSNHPAKYKHILSTIVLFNYQLEFYANELLMPLILTNKDHLIQLYLDKKRHLEEHLLQLLDHLYENGGKRLRGILSNEFGVSLANNERRSLSKLAVRYWNLLGHGQDDMYPNLAVLPHRRTLGYLFNVKYDDMHEERSMSDECWNEAIEVNTIRTQIR